ncbi:hypothetical protein ACFQV2_18065 [Actinokineospora soli]|uniref:Glycosyl hydrolase family 32 N-terminal domain-containing protein n=1 Tax=Actinokineospora soli TaxID=1048753 RepID=A0ABW2TP04_9PSEU
MYFLKASRALGDPDRRHWHATVGHAVSADLVTWREVADALAPGPPGSFDDVATWTGSVVRSGDTWHMFYTGAGSAERGLKQRIGVATSTDLHTWHKHDGPVLSADPAGTRRCRPPSGRTRRSATRGCSARPTAGTCWSPPAR